MIKKFPVCNKEFYLKPSWIKRVTTCSMRCQGEMKKGKKHSEVTKAKMRGRIPWNKGIKYLQISGEKHWNWKGGIRKRKDERNDSAYQLWVKKVKNRDNNQCTFKGQNCFGYCVVHHILPWRDYPELRYEIKNGITLCQYHHPRKRVDEQRLIPFFQATVMSREII